MKPTARLRKLSAGFAKKLTMSSLHGSEISAVVAAAIQPVKAHRNQDTGLDQTMIPRVFVQTSAFRSMERIIIQVGISHTQEPGLKRVLYLKRKQGKQA